MKIKSLKHNYIMYSIRMLSGLIFTLLVFPYVAKKIGVENIGKIQFVESIIVYFLLFIDLGIPIYGKREVAFEREDIKGRSKLIVELLIILLISSIVVSVFYFCLINNFSFFIEYKPLFFIFSLKILLNIFGVEWFFLGIEDQDYITKRALFFKVVSAILILIFIKTKDDYIKYCLILIFSLMGSNILNFKRMLNYISINRELINNIEIKKHIKPICFLFTTSAATKIFSSFDSIMIRIFTDNVSLGYYAIANKIGRMPLMATTAIFVVFYPRLCNLYNKKNNKEYIELANKSLSYSLLIAIPFTIIVFSLAPEIINLLAGKEFEKSIIVLRGFSFLIIAMVYSYFTGNNLVINLEEKKFMKGQLLASGSNIVFNSIFIPLLGPLGAALGTVIAEMIATFYRIITARSIFIHFNLLDFNKIKMFLSGILSLLISIILKKYIIINLFIEISLISTVILFSYIIFLILLKEETIYRILKIRKKV